MQREDVEALCAPIEKIVNYEYSSRDALIHNCDLGTIDMGKLQDLCAALRALLAERDAAFAAGLEAAAEAVLYLCRMKGMGNRTIDGPEVAHLIRALPIKPRP